MNTPTKLKEVNKILYPFGRKTTIRSNMYSAYYRVYLISQLGFTVTKEMIEREEKINRESHK